MSETLKPGLYKATVRGVPDTTVFVDSAGWGRTSEYVLDHREHLAREFITDARGPLTVIDFNIYSVAVSQVLINAGYSIIAEQILTQTKPARIPEPTLWGVVLAYATKGDTIRREWDHRHDGWWTPGYTVFPWGNLVDPILIREGIN